MKRLIWIFIFIAILLSGANAQVRKGMRPEILERMKVEKISFLATQLDMTPAEAQVFWPVYNEFDKKRLKIEVAKRKMEIKTNGNLETFSEAELKGLSDEYIETFSEEAQLMKEYNKKFLEVLPIQKVIKLYQSERKFSSHMLQEFRRRQLETQQ